jgi:hypothetical protein
MKEKGARSEDSTEMRQHERLERLAHMKKEKKKEKGGRKIKIKAEKSNEWKTGSTKENTRKICKYRKEKRK